ncbi:MAG: hypothetical protein PHD76_12770 [Methylacidiphilales bacterium]|nr:hypothetical protein [Candidatus Methylacidiphilales bacterium]
MKKNKTTIKASELDRIFDEGGDITPYLDLSRAWRPGLEQKRVNVDFPQWVIDSLDFQATRLGVTRQSIIKVWIAERLKEENLLTSASRPMTYSVTPPACRYAPAGAAPSQVMSDAGRSTKIMKTTTILFLTISLICSTALARDTARDLRRMVGYTIISADTVEKVLTGGPGEKYIRLSGGTVLKVRARLTADVRNKSGQIQGKLDGVPYFLH